MQQRRSQPRDVALSLQRVIQQSGGPGRRTQPQALSLEIGLDLAEGFGTDQIAEVDTNLAIGLAHHLELGIYVPHRDPGQGDRVLAPSRVPAVVSGAVVKQPGQGRHLPVRGLRRWYGLRPTRRRTR